MKINQYQILCSNEILKLITGVLKTDYEFNEISDNYNNLFKESSSVDYVWSLISTSLLISENLYKYNKVYQLISDKTIELIEEKLIQYSNIYPGDLINIPCLLDSKNNIANPFKIFINDKYQYNKDEIYDYKFLDEPFDVSYCEEEKKFIEMCESMEDKFDSIRVDGPYGCNDSIIENNELNIKKLIMRTRNALAHSNYEIIDDNNIRLYHYNRKLKKLDFNVVLNSSIVVLMVDELNEIASKKYSCFLDIYSNSNIPENLLSKNFHKEDYINYMMFFELFDIDIADEIYEVAKTEKEFINKYHNYSDTDRLDVINDLIYERIKPVYDVGIIINDYLYCDKSGKITSDELYDKYGFYKYLNSCYYDTVESKNNGNIYLKNKLKFLLLSFLNCSLLTGYNINENKDIGIIDFSKMYIDEEIIRNFLIKNGIKANETLETLERKLENTKIDIELKQNSIDKKRQLILENNIENDYYLVKLPNEIKKLEENKNSEIDCCNQLESEISCIKKLGCMYNYEENLSNFVFSSLRNSLAHGYIKFPNNIDLNNISNTVICFEDYNPVDKKELTFKGIITLGDLLKTLTSREYVDIVFNNEIANKSVKSKVIKKD